jgi:hypothetical protein
LHIFALSVTTSLKIPGAVIPRRVFTRPGTIADLLYEAISGLPDADLKRACDSVLRDIRNRELGSD